MKRLELDQLSYDVLRNYYRCNLCDLPLASIDILGIATQEFHLSLTYDDLSERSGLLGFVTKGDTFVNLSEHEVKLHFYRDHSLVVDQRLSPDYAAVHDGFFAGPRRFTIAHECGHCLLRRLRLPNTEENANELASALLLPNCFLLPLLETYHGGKSFIQRGPVLALRDQEALARMAHRVSVSSQAMAIRLAQFGYYHKEESHPCLTPTLPS